MENSLSSVPTLATSWLDGVWIPVRQGWRSRPKEVVADKAYNGDFVRHYLRKRGIQALIPEIRLPKGHKRRKRGPHYRFDKHTYKERNVIERLINHLKEMRCLATRFEKLATHFLAMVKSLFGNLYLASKWQMFFRHTLEKLPKNEFLSSIKIKQ